MLASIALYERCLDQFDGTPEEFGALLATATSGHICGRWTCGEFEQQRNVERASARRRISKLKDGRELLRREHEG